LDKYSRNRLNGNFPAYTTRLLLQASHGRVRTQQRRTNETIRLYLPSISLRLANYLIYLKSVWVLVLAEYYLRVLPETAQANSRVCGRIHFSPQCFRNFS